MLFIFLSGKKLILYRIFMSKHGSLNEYMKGRKIKCF